MLPLLGLQVHSLGQGDRLRACQCVPQHLPLRLPFILGRRPHGFGLGLLHGRVDYTPKVAEVVYNCNLCGACDVSCKYAMEFDVLEPLYAIRHECVKNGQTVPVWDELVEKMQKQGPMVLDAKGKRGHWYKGLGVKTTRSRRSRSSFTPVVWPAMMKPAASAARTALSLLQKAGVDVGIAKDRELCCGGRAYEMGYRRGAEAGRTECGPLQGVGGQGAGHRLRPLLPVLQGSVRQAGLNCRSEGVAHHRVPGPIGRGKKLKPKKSVDMTVTYHDPCHLGRLSEPWIPWKGVQRERHMRVYDPPRVLRRGTYGVYEPPRELLRSIPGLKLVEMDRIREYAWCCGAGGGVREATPSSPGGLLPRGLSEAESTGAQALVTACPHCVQNLE